MVLNSNTFTSGSYSVDEATTMAPELSSKIDYLLITLRFLVLRLIHLRVSLVITLIGSRHISDLTVPHILRVECTGKFLSESWRPTGCYSWQR